MSKTRTFSQRLAEWQHRRALLVLLISLLVAAASVPLILRLGLNSSFSALLPSDKPSVHDLEAVRGRMGGLSTLSIAIQSPSGDVPAMQRFATDLAKRIESSDDPNIVSVEWNVAEYEQFVKRNEGLYAPLSDLEEMRQDIEERLEHERAKANPFYFDLEDEEPESIDDALKRLTDKVTQGESKFEKFPSGYYLSKDRKLLAMFLRTDVRGGDTKSAEALISSVQADVQELDPNTYGPDLLVEYAGDLLHQREEQDAIARELIMATSLTIVLVLGAIVAFFRRWRAIPLLGLSLAVPTLVTFAVAELLVDYLNSSTAFLGSIVIGNGINPNIIWLARFFEERRLGRGVQEALSMTHQRTWSATITASAAAAVAYGSLTITDFRGFRDFGIIGGIGMVLCWFGAYLLLPSYTSLFERFRPLLPPNTARRSTSFGRLFSRIVFARPGTLTVVSVIAATAGLGLTIKAVLDDPIEYDFRNLRSVREETSRASQLNGQIKKIVGSSAAGQAIAVVLPSVEAAQVTRRQLEAKRDNGEIDHGRVRSIDDLMPDRQEQKLPILRDIRKLLLDAKKFAKGEQLEKIEAHLPREDLRVLTYADLPLSVARSFTERDGTRGKILFVEQNKDFSLWDGRYLVDWANDLRKLRLEDGSRPPLAGRAPIFADMIEVVWNDGPKAVLASFTATFLLVSFAFRRWRERLLSVFALLLGIVLMAGVMAIAGMKLNFLNFVAFPITFGNGVDYGVNVLRRFSAESRDGASVTDAVRRAIESSGGAVALCSLTTIIGYNSLYASANKALNSFGAAMAISEVTCLFAAIVTVPAILLWRESRRARNSSAT